MADLAGFVARVVAIQVARAVSRGPGSTSWRGGARPDDEAVCHRSVIMHCPEITLAEAEKKYAKKNLPGRPNTKKKERLIKKMQAAAKAKAKSTSRCRAVTQVEKIKI